MHVKCCLRWRHVQSKRALDILMRQCVRTGSRTLVHIVIHAACRHNTLTDTIGHREDLEKHEQTCHNAHLHHFGATMKL